jgi:acid phosphatase class B
MKAIKKVTLSLLLVVCLLVVVNGSASAMTASGGGFSGLINIPTADILSTNQATIGYQLIDNGDKVLLNYGIENNIEFGLTGYWYDEERNNGDDSDLFLNVKMLFKNNSELGI